MRKQSGRGFTLIEIMVVIAIILILFALLLGVISRMRQAALKVVCMSNLRQIGLAVQNYATDNRNLYPSAVDQYLNVTWVNEILPYLAANSVLICPCDTNVATSTYVTIGGSPNAKNNATFANTFVSNGSITFRSLPAYSCSSSHHMVLTMTINGVTTTITSNSAQWVSGNPGASGPGVSSSGSMVTVIVSGPFNPNQIDLEVAETPFNSSTPGYNSGYYNHGWRPITSMNPNGMDPYARAYPAAFYSVWGVPMGANSIVYCYNTGISEFWFYPRDIGNCFYTPDPTEIPDVEQWVLNIAAPGYAGYGPADAGFVMTINPGPSSSPNQAGAGSNLAIRNGQFFFVRSSYAYNVQIANRSRQTVPGNYAAMVEYTSVIICKPLSDPVGDIAQRHAGSRVNVLMVDGSVMSMSLSELLINNNSTFAPCIWEP